MGEAIASAVLPSLLGGILGKDEPSYQMPSMDQILTPAQKALQGDLAAIGKLGSKWGQEYFNEDRFNKNKAAYNSIMNRLQGNPTTGVSAPPTTGVSQPTATPSSFAPNEELEGAIQYLDNAAKMGQPKFVGGAFSAGSVQGFDNPIVQKLASGQITPEMLEAYKRQKQQAADAKLLGGR